MPASVVETHTAGSNPEAAMIGLLKGDWRQEPWENTAGLAANEEDMVR